MFYPQLNPLMHPEPHSSSNHAPKEPIVYSNNVLGLTESEMVEDIEDVLCNMQFDEIREIELFLQSLGSECG